MKRLILIFISVIFFITLAPCQQTTTTGGEDFNTVDRTTKAEKNKKEESEEKAFKKGSFAIIAGYGFPNLYKALFKSLIVNTSSLGSIYSNSTFAYSNGSFGPVFLKAEYGLTKLIGLGISAGYFNTTLTETESYADYNAVSGFYENYQDVTKYTYSSLSVAARINFHFGTGERLDPYAGVALGYSYSQSSSTFSSNNPNFVRRNYSHTGIPLHFAINVGMRYYFTRNIGIYGEIGFEKWSLIQGGLALKF